MEYRTLGKTGLKVSEIGFGGEWVGGYSLEEVKNLTDCCEENGINFLDCWMADPVIRSNLGDAIKETRDEWYIQGHFGSTWIEGQYVRIRDLDKVKKAFNDLLNRFHTDYLDIGMIHFVDEIDEYEKIMNGEFFDYVLKQHEEGIIGHIGISTHNTDVANLAVNSDVFETIMFSANPAFDMLAPTEDINDFSDEKSFNQELHGMDPQRADFYESAEKNNVGVTIMKPFAGGRLFNANDSPFGVALTPIQCIHYCLSQSGVASVMGGYATVSEIEEAISYETATEEMKNYSEVLKNSPKNSYLGQCTYCGHCAPCSENIDIAMVNKYYDLAKVHDDIPDSLKLHYDSLSANAGDCSQCGDCESRCPFNVEIMDKMIEINEYFNGE